MRLGLVVTNRLARAPERPCTQAGGDDPVDPVADAQRLRDVDRSLHQSLQLVTIRRRSTNGMPPLRVRAMAP